MPRGSVSSTDSSNRRLTTLTWAAFLSMWGITALVENYTGVSLRNLQYVLAGVILLGLNGARYLKGIPMSRLTLIVGVMAVAGGVVRQATGEFSLLGVVLIAVGSVLLVQGLMMRGDSAGTEEKGRRAG